MTEHDQNAQNSSNGLWIPFTIIFIGIVVSLVFAVQTLRGYRKPRPLLIRPSSVDQASELAGSVYKALYPLKIQGYGIEYKSDGSSFGSELGASLVSIFGSESKNIKTELYKIDLTAAYDNNKTDCLNTALFNMLRKPKRHWTRSIYFSVCTESDKSFKIYYSRDKNSVLN